MRLALSIVADQLGQEILVPWVAAEEGAASHRRLLERVVAQVISAEDSLRRGFGPEYHIDMEPLPDIDEDVARWRAELSELATILPLEGGAAREALRREIYGVAPARRTENSGSGARDAAIWLAVAADHAKRAEAGHLITANTKDFARNGHLRPELTREIPSTASPLHLHPGTKAFLEHLGTPRHDANVTLEALARWAEPALVRGLKDSPAVVHAVVDRKDPGLWYGATIASATPTEINRVLRYERGQDAVTIVDASWKITAELDYYPAAEYGDDARWVIDGVCLEGSVQLYLAEQNGEHADASMIRARLTSNTTVNAHEDGTAEVWTVG